MCLLCSTSCNQNLLRNQCHTSWRVSQMKFLCHWCQYSIVSLTRLFLFPWCFLVLHLLTTLFLLFGAQWALIFSMKQALTTHEWGELEIEKTLHIISKCLYFSVSHIFSLYCMSGRLFFSGLKLIILPCHVHIILSTVVVLLRIISIVGEVPYAVCFVTSSRFLLPRYDQNSGLLEFWLECYSLWWILAKVENWKKKLAPVWHTCQQT